MSSKRKDAPTSEPKAIKKTRREREEERNSLDDASAPESLRAVVIGLAKPLFQPGTLSQRKSTEITHIKCAGCDLPIATVTQKQDASSIVSTKITWKYPAMKMGLLRAEADSHELRITKGDTIAVVCRPCVLRQLGG